MTPVPLLPLPGTPQAPDPLGGFRGLQPTPYWVSAGAFSVDGVYLDPCDDHPLINDPAAGNASDSYYLPLLQQPERTLTPTYTPTLHPGCYLTLSTQSAVNVREYPTAGAIVGQILPSDPPTRVLGISMQLMDGVYWYLVYREAGWNLPEIQTGWSSGAFVELQDTYECELLNEFDVTVTPIVALPTHTPSMTPPQTYSPTPTFGVSPSPTATPTRVPRIVETQAKPFHDRADQFGLPLPFEVWPRATPQSGFQNGYGPNLYAYNSCNLNLSECQYNFTGKIHQGID